MTLFFKSLQKKPRDVVFSSFQPMHTEQTAGKRGWVNWIYRAVNWIDTACLVTVIVRVVSVRLVFCFLAQSGSEARAGMHGCSVTVRLSQWAYGIVKNLRDRDMGAWTTPVTVWGHSLCFFKLFVYSIYGTSRSPSRCAVLAYHTQPCLFSMTVTTVTVTRATVCIVV
jgi:hypothetical protein